MRDLEQRSAFTLVELLVVLAIIAILIAMLLPAVNTVRESARRAACGNNIRNLAVALNNYHQSNRTYPPAMYVAAGEDPTASTTHRINWVIAILPQLEQETTYRQFDFTKPISDMANYRARGLTIPVMRCPSDTGAEVTFGRESEGENWARGNYGANASLQHLSTSNVGASSSLWTKGWIRGVMGANTALSIDEIADGQSCTILLGELRIGLSALDRRGTWALGGPGSSSIWAHGSDDGAGPNNCNGAADNILGCPDLSRDPGRTRLTRECMGCSTTSRNSQGTMRSRHPGGVHVAMVDSSVRFISDFIERSPISVNTRDVRTWANDFRVWERLNASSDRLPVETSKF